MRRHSPRFRRCGFNGSRAAGGRFDGAIEYDPQGGRVKSANLWGAGVTIRGCGERPIADECGVTYTWDRKAWRAALVGRRCSFDLKAYDLADLRIHLPLMRTRVRGVVAGDGGAAVAGVSDVR